MVNRGASFWRASAGVTAACLLFVTVAACGTVGDEPGSLSLRNVTFCAPGDITVMVLAADGSGACVQPLGGNYTCTCGSDSGATQLQSVALEVAYLNETTGTVMPGAFVVCGAVARPGPAGTVPSAVITGVSIGASIALPAGAVVLVRRAVPGFGVFRWLN